MAVAVAEIQQAVIGMFDLSIACFVCKKTQFVIDALFDWKPM